jgi:hypothetical protein
MLLTIKSVPLLPKLRGQFAEFLKYCSPITLAYSACVLESDLVRSFLFPVPLNKYKLYHEAYIHFSKTMSSIQSLDCNLRNRFYRRNFIIRRKPNTFGEHYYQLIAHVYRYLWQHIYYKFSE